MPSLKDLNCTIELAQAHKALPEYDTVYGDGVVETFVPIPRQPQPFSIHITSTKFIAPGIAIFVYIDGVYQCNRNRQGLKPGQSADKRSLVDFRVRQKEERRKDGSMIAREWTFDTSSTGSANGVSDSFSSTTLDNKDCIEVVVLRCAGTRDAKSVSPMNLDGAGDWSDCYLSLDVGSPSSSHKGSVYDDRDTAFNRFGCGSGPTPPPSSYRAPYAETLPSYEGSNTQTHRKTHCSQDKYSRASASHRSKHGSRYSGTISPLTRRADDLPPSGFQYGSGPVPSEKASHHKKQRSSAPEINGVDPVWLNKILKTAVKQGIEESRQVDARSERHDRDSGETSQNGEVTSQAPGAWPKSPCLAPEQASTQTKRASTHKRNPHSGAGSDWGESQDGWSQHETKDKAGTHVNWDMEPAWETGASNGNNGWHSNDDTPSDSWDTDETWRADKSHLRPMSSKTDYRTHSKDERWVDDVTSSNSVSSSNDTIQPSHLQGHVQTPGPRFKGHTRASKSMHDRRGRDSSRHSRHQAPWQPAESEKISASSRTTQVMPVIMNAPDTTFSKHSGARRSSTHADAGVSASPVPAWVAAVQDTMRKHGNSPSAVPPAPDAESAKESAKNASVRREKKHRYIPSSTWDTNEKSALESNETPTWNKNEKPAWENNQKPVHDSSKESSWDTAAADTSWSSSDKNERETGWSTASSTSSSPTWTAEPNARKPSKRTSKAKTTKALHDLRTTLEKTLPSKATKPKHYTAVPPPTQLNSNSNNVPKNIKNSKKPRVPPFAKNWFFPPLSLPHSPSPLHPSSPTKPPSTVKSAIRTTNATSYGHAIARPVYLDSFEKPYAVFRFRCRKRGVGLGEEREG